MFVRARVNKAGVVAGLVPVVAFVGLQVYLAATRGGEAVDAANRVVFPVVVVLVVGLLWYLVFLSWRARRSTRVVESPAAGEYREFDGSHLR